MLNAKKTIETIESCLITYKQNMERIKKNYSAISDGDGDMLPFYVTNRAIDDLVKLSKEGGDPMVKGKDDTIAGLRVLVKGKDDTIAGLRAMVSKLQAYMNKLQGTAGYLLCAAMKECVDADAEFKRKRKGRYKKQQGKREKMTRTL